VNYFCKTVPISLSLVGALCTLFTLLSYALGYVIVVKDSEGHLALNLAFLLNLAETVLGRHGRRVALKDGQRSATFWRARRYFSGSMLSYQHVLPTVPGALESVKRLQETTACVSRAILQVVVVKPVRRFILCRGRDVPGQRLIVLLREQTDAVLARLDAQAASDDLSRLHRPRCRG